MNITARRKGRTGFLAGIAVITTVAVLSAASPALADTEGDAATRAAAAVERATGTSDLAALSVIPGSAASAVVSSEANSVAVTAPVDSSGFVESTAADGTSFRLGLPETKKVIGVRAGAGTVVYADAAQSADLAVQPTADGGARTLVTLKDDSAPDEYRFGLGLPADTELIADGYGGYLISRPGSQGATVLGSIAAPWAKDANGEAVSTSYRIDSGSLVQTVSTTANTAFPVVADPSISYGWNIYIKFNKTEVKRLNNKVQYADTAVALCGLLINPVAAVGCAGLGTAVIKRIQRVWRYAAEHKRCVELSISYAGLFNDVKHYAC